VLAPAVLSALLAAGTQAPPAPPPRAQKADRDFPEIGVAAELVELDVIVTDGKDHPLTDLGPEDFEVREEGRLQAITHFAPGFRTRPLGRPSAGEPVPGPAAFPDAGPRARHLVLVVDDYHLEPEDLSPVKAALLRFIDAQLAASDQAVVVAASGSLGPLQQFTTDRDVLRRAVSRLRVQNRSFRPPSDVPRMTDYQAELIESGDQEALDLAAKEIMVAERQPADPTQPEGKGARTRAEGRARALARGIVSVSNQVTGLTLSSLERLVRGLLPLRGRKVVALFSSGFFLGPERRSSRRDLQAIADAAARSGVVLYSIDARGLVATPAIGDARVGGGYDITSNPGVREHIELRGLEAPRDGLNALALDTGGLPFFNRNDLEGSLKRVLEDSATYYRLGFEPRDSPRDGRFHKIEVRIRGRSGLRVRTASGYFAGGVPAASESKSVAGPAGSPEEEANRLLRSALDSSYPLRALPVELTAEFVGTSSGDVVVATACLDVSRLPFQPAAEGHEAAAFDLVGVVVDEEGKAVGQFSDRVELSLTPEAKERALRNGLTYRKTLAVRPGLLQARVAVRADGSGLLGSAAQWVEVPDRARPGLALSSVLLLAEGEDAAPGPPTARGTASFDRPRLPEVARRFPRGAHLDYLLLVYDRGTPGVAPPVDVVVERQILSGSTILTRSAPSPVTEEGPTGVPVVSGRLRLDPFVPGDYELRLVVSNRATKATAARSLRFTVE
jgi:VWFA-related protein